MKAQHIHDFTGTLADYGATEQVTVCICGLLCEQIDGHTRLKWPGQDWLQIDPAMLRVVCAPPVSLVNVEKV